MTYAELVAALTSLVVTDASDTDFTAILPRAIEAAELRILRELSPIAFLKTAGLAVTAGVSEITLPADHVAPRSFTLTTASGQRQDLLRRDIRFLREYWPDESATGTPKYWADLNGTSCNIAPTPSQVFALELLYLSRPAGLSAGTTTTWLSTELPDLLLAGCRSWLAGYLKEYGRGDDPQAATFWEGEYVKRLAAAQGIEAQRRGLQDTPPGLKPG